MSNEPCFFASNTLLAVTELVAPDIYPVEIAHVLAKGFRQGKLTAAEADAHLGNILTSLPQLIPSFELLPRAFAIAQQTRTGLYDALYLALGEAESISVVTADLKLAKLSFNVIDIHELPYPPP